MSLLDHPFLAPAGAATGGLKRALALSATLVLVAFAILLPVMQSSDEAAQGYRIRALQQRQEDLEAQIYSAQSDIAQLGALSRIDGEARNRLGMVPVINGVNVSVGVPIPEVHSIPNGYLPHSAPPMALPGPSLMQTLMQKVLHIISRS